MSKKRKSMYKSYVYHPRYGDKPIYTGACYPTSKILQAHWQYDETSIFPETAILADTNLQNYSVYPIEIYVDIEKKCRDCNHWFLFFAQEQKYWFEILRFYVDSDCVKCIDCRKKDHNIKSMINDYEKLVKNQNRSRKETSKLKNIALELFQLGYIKDRQKVDSIS
ncbi:MAG: zinc-ribbon domain-containing protein [Gammaproteobacteria bacterium]|nr:zinc-ribbon domain-containing protein [Gammaproteobacteria bacterium]